MFKPSMASKHTLAETDAAMPMDLNGKAIAFTGLLLFIFGFNFWTVVTIVGGAFAYQSASVTAMSGNADQQTNSAPWTGLPRDNDSSGEEASHDETSDDGVRTDSDPASSAAEEGGNCEHQTGNLAIDNNSNESDDEAQEALRDKLAEAATDVSLNCGSHAPECDSDTSEMQRGLPGALTRLDMATAEIDRHESAEPIVDYTETPCRKRRRHSHSEDE